jgi:pteridine reductase
MRSWPSRKKCYHSDASAPFLLREILVKSGGNAEGRGVIEVLCFVLLWSSARREPRPPNTHLSGDVMQQKVALVTGSGKRRVGSVVAEALAQDGYHIAVHYRSSPTEAAETVAQLRLFGIEAEAFQADLTQEQAIQQMMQAVLKRFGRIDVLVNAAAAWKSKPFEEITAADVRHYFETNTLGTFLCSQQAGLHMLKQPTGGCIITIGDWACERPYQNYAAYFPSKGATPTLTRTLAVELGTRNPAIRVNCILPGPVMLPLDLPAEEREEAIAATLVKREGKPENIAQAVQFFIQNDFVTGVCLPVDGGRTIYAP